MDDKFKIIRDLKNLYEDFNDSYINDLNGAAKRLDELIEIYKTSDIRIFIEFSGLIRRYRESIVNPFIYVYSLSDSNVKRQLSNGPFESFNNVPSTIYAS